ncbi:uncharacterized protein L969DRAFT_84337 [Mixia osmundae IAM 14324]|uniref:ATP-grasp domain-containing protein n=1 Tax=Mixia osmundae (strain CBS 9802 / IAM 14324 / JCM 22182 / KY 12970) TaxID=764103 RepID=G7E354_MIXOS|nr:uncharacterized protein L969DRAFT_84337 [Mixia osmundae IAM 14324]KEI42480.1 hypothetical protein L969DRAFT_84337 [Mixia osmundae IAM 14324]GAA97235.1 hypothetical protein E5Q_03911 [Mixia osmundae IAM 14324]
MSGKPSYVQSSLTTLLLVALSMSLAPVTAFVCLLCHVCQDVHRPIETAKLWIRLVRETTGSRSSDRTVLITGGRTTKSLVLIRAFSKAGWRVILAEESQWGNLAASRWSNAVDRYYPLPDPSQSSADKAEYFRRLKYIIAIECVNLWLPCSSAGASVEDAHLADHIRSSGSHCRVFLPTETQMEDLHWKDRFETLCRLLDMPVPEAQTVTSIDQAVTFLHSSTSTHRFLAKSLGLDDVGRGDMTLLPLQTPQETRAHFERLSVAPSKQTPYVLQRYVSGHEYCTHAAVSDGKILSFVACRSNDMLMRYVDLSHHEPNVATQAWQWTETFLQRWQTHLTERGSPQASFTGHISFDFIREPTEETLYAIECNPRVHTAVTLFDDKSALASSYLYETEISPPPRVMAKSWLVHSVPLAAFNTLPQSLRTAASRLHPRLFRDRKWHDVTASPMPGMNVLALLGRHAVGLEKDAVFDACDPLPFFVLAHVQWPWFLLRVAFSGRGWDRANVSTSRIFTC